MYTISHTVLTPTDPRGLQHDSSARNMLIHVRIKLENTIFTYHLFSMTVCKARLQNPVGYQEFDFKALRVIAVFLPSESVESEIRA